MRWLLAAMVLFAGCEEPIPGHIRYGRVHQPAGSRTIYIDVQRWWRELLSIEPGRWRHLAYATESEAYTRTREADGVGLNDAA